MLQRLAFCVKHDDDGLDEVTIVFYANGHQYHYSFLQCFDTVGHYGRQEEHLASINLIVGGDLTRAVCIYDLHIFQRIGCYHRQYLYHLLLSLAEWFDILVLAYPCSTGN